ncbi:MAG: DUF72 domain-containing protein [Candidatus Thermoplasmatota archaeon]|nr:DUF72 domain-containing protein [Candidatus Thermoplasmatota archaeon]
MKLYAGTSGWSYPWNPDGLEWYINTGLKAVELNSSFYHFPYRNNVASWKRKSEGKLRWSVKVNRNVTHTHKLNEKSYDLWERFAELFSPMNDLIDFFLFQLPPSFKGGDENLNRIESFVEQTKIRNREKIAIEPRDASWLEYVKDFQRLGITLVSVDCPDFQWLLKTSDVSYFRFHGHKDWYAYRYSDEELMEFIRKQKALDCDRNYAFFNNDLGMLENAKSYARMWSEIME